VHIFAECKTNISVVLTVTSGLDSHMMSKLESHGTQRMNLVEVATPCFGRLLSCVLIMGLLSHDLKGVATPSYYLRLLPW